MSLLFFEDFIPGSAMTYGARTVSAADIIAFAREYDAQPMHLGEAEAKTSFFGEHIGSGWHLCCLTMRAIADELLAKAHSMGSPGIEQVEWLAPLRPGDSITVHQEVLETRASRSRPEMGLVRFRFTVVNQNATPLMRQTNWIIFGTRIAPPAIPRQPEERKPVAADSPSASTVVEPQRYFDELEVGATQVLGDYLFTAEDIIRFARAFDPQPFHLDEAAARASHFGGLCASGWHTAAVWMKLMGACRSVAAVEAIARRGHAARLGPSPGLRHVKWLKPVYAGDRLTYSTAITNKRPSASRPQWGLVFHHNTAHNQLGEQVFAFDGVVFWERSVEHPA
ncbi:MaoC family dehydratase [Chelatococcus sp. GCM10030263]|uniref:MaoC family dehydratase n=1 Tax=Chelatococcus sp. GCM10030263 TaxID=3273387 RepID=UPI00361A3628